MSEEREMKLQLVAALALSNAVNEAQPHARRMALEDLHEAIQGGRHLIQMHAQDLLEGPDE